MIRSERRGCRRTLDRVAEGYTAALGGGENVVGAAALGLMLPVADTVGATNINEAAVGKELITNRPLSDSERVTKGIIGTVQVANTAATVLGAAEMVGPVAGARAAVGARRGLLQQVRPDWRPVELV